MISKLIIVDVNVSDEMKSILENIKGSDAIITYYDYSQGFIVDGANLLVDTILVLIRSYLETTTINFEHLCFLNFDQMLFPNQSSKYNNEVHAVKGIESDDGALDSWNFMEKLVSDITKTTEMKNIDFIDIDQLCFPKEHEIIFDKIQEITQNIEGRNIDYLKVGESDKDLIYDSSNWLHTMFTTFYEGSNKILLDKYFKVNNTTIGYLNTKTIELRNFRIFDSQTPSVDFENGKINICIIPLFNYSEIHFQMLGNMTNMINDQTIVDFVYQEDTTQQFIERLTKKLDNCCGNNKDKINEVNACLWFNPTLNNPSLSLNDNMTANIDEELINVVNQLVTNNTENVEQLKSHFVVNLNETLIDYFNMNIYVDQTIKKINFEIFNISESYNTNYNILCNFLHNDYFVSTLVNFNLTFLSYADISQNLFELTLPTDVSQNIFKDSPLMQDISNNIAFQDLYIVNTSHVNKGTDYNVDVNLATYLTSAGSEIDQFMKPNIITNVILFQII